MASRSRPRRTPVLSVAFVCLALAGLPSRSASQALSGRVVSLVGQDPVPTAVVVLTGTPHHVFTDSAGAFSFDGVRPGRYELLVQHPGYHTLRRQVEVSAGGRTGLTLHLELRVTVLDPIRARVVAPLERRRRARGTAHHVYINRPEVEAYVRRGALHVGDALRLHAPAAVHVVESGVTRARWGPAVCIKSTRAWTRRSVSNPDGGECAAVFVDGVRLGPLGTLYLHDLPLSDVEAIEFVPPVDALTRFGHAGEDGAVVITTRRGTGLTPGLVGPVHPLPDLPVDAQRHNSYLAAGATVGFFAAFGVGYAHGLFREGAEFCTSDCTRDVLQMLGTVALGLGVGELLYRLKTER